jgi:hypothetical protein
MKIINPANVLIAIRDHVANDEDSLLKEFGDNPYGPYQMQNVLRQLQDAGLIVQCKNPEGENGGSQTLSRKFEVVPNWYSIQATLGLSLSRLGQVTSDSMVVRPYFGVPHGISDPLDVFVMMPFKDELHAVYQNHILKVARSLRLTAKRGDDFFGAHHIMADIWEALNKARIIVADCTDRNPNVFYEIGMAHTLGRSVVLITQKTEDVPFDLQAIRYIKYEYTPPGMKSFEKQLAKTLKAELDLVSSKPVSAYGG